MKTGQHKARDRARLSEREKKIEEVRERKRGHLQILNDSNGSCVLNKKNRKDDGFIRFIKSQKTVVPSDLLSNRNIVYEYIKNVYSVKVNLNAYLPISLHQSLNNPEKKVKS